MAPSIENAVAMPPAGSEITDAGLYQDFNGRLARVARFSARHSTITLTIDHYTHVQEEQRAALAKLPPVA